MAHTPISMRCTQEQFEEIRPILEANGCNVSDIHPFYAVPYLINFRFDEINNITNYDLPKPNSKVYEIWNAEIFLKACGIKVGKIQFETDTQHDVAIRVIEVMKRLNKGEITMWSAGEQIAAEIEAYAEMKVKSYIGKTKVGCSHNFVQQDMQWSKCQYCGQIKPTIIVNEGGKHE